MPLVRNEQEAVNILQALSCCICIYTSTTLHTIQTQNLTLIWDHNRKGAKLNLSVLGSHLRSLGLSWHPAFHAHVHFHSSSKKKLVNNPELLIQERFQRLAEFQTTVHGKNQVHRFVGKRCLYPRSICTCSRVVLKNGTTLGKEVRGN